MQNEVVKKNIQFKVESQMVDNLNEQSFVENNISEDYYYKTYGLMTLDLKEKIENGIKEKFDQDSDILDEFDWNSAPKDDSGYSDGYKKYFFYTMLYREFNFEKEFSELTDDTFTGQNEVYEGIKYFGIDEDSSSRLYSQVEVLYYNSDEDYAVSLETKEGDHVILASGIDGGSYQDIWNNINNKKEKYSGKTNFTEYDSLKVPNIEYNVLKEYTELEEDGSGDKIFYDSEGDECYIEKAIQTIKFSLNKSGGKIKSEAAIAMCDTASIMPSDKDIEYRNFNFDSSFTMFLLEDGEELPYFATTIDDITLYQ
jgi:hypothetical protein